MKRKTCTKVAINLTCFFWKHGMSCVNPPALEYLLLIFRGTGKPQESTASAWIDFKCDVKCYRLFLTEWADFILATTVINMPKKLTTITGGRKRNRSEEDWSSASERWLKLRCEPVSLVMIRGGDGGTPWWMEATSYGPLKRPECLWERSQEADPTSQIQMEISVCAFFPCAGPTPRKTSHLWNLWLFLSILLGSDPIWEGRAGLYTEGGFSPQIQ